VNRDEWGGFFDHVAPPRAVAPNSTDVDLMNGKALLGCRVPVVIASPFTRGNPLNPRVNSLLYDHTSVLKLIEWRWGLPPLTPRDASTQVANLAYALNFGSPDPSAPLLPQIAVPRPTPCNNAGILDGIAGGQTDSYRLLHSDLMQGWTLPPGLL
jgi:phospholipase C